MRPLASAAAAFFAPRFRPSNAPSPTKSTSGSPDDAGLPAAEDHHQDLGHFRNDEAATKLIWLALRSITAKWRRAAHHWQAAMNQFAILYEGRFTKPAV